MQTPQIMIQTKGEQGGGAVRLHQYLVYICDTIDHKPVDTNATKTFVYASDHILNWCSNKVLKFENKIHWVLHDTS